jgi:hypothetical protein
MRVSQEPVWICLFRKIQFLAPCIWDLSFMSYRLCRLILKKIRIAPFINYVSSFQTHNSRICECMRWRSWVSGNTYFDARYSAPPSSFVFPRLSDMKQNIFLHPASILRISEENIVFYSQREMKVWIICDCKWEPKIHSFLSMGFLFCRSLETTVYMYFSVVFTPSPHSHRGSVGSYLSNF